MLTKRKKRYGVIKKQSNKHKLWHFILLFILILIVFLLLLPKHKLTTDIEDITFSEDWTEEDFIKLNKYLEENNYSWRAGDSNVFRNYLSLTEEEKENFYTDFQLPEEIAGINIFEESITYDNYLEYIDESYEASEIKTQSQKNRLTGLLSLPIFSVFYFPKNLFEERYQDIKVLDISKEIKDQNTCRGCNAFSTTNFAEAYVKSKLNKDYVFSTQYVLSYLNNKGCISTPSVYYLPLITNNKTIIDNNPLSEQDMLFFKNYFNPENNEIVGPSMNTFIDNWNEGIMYFMKRSIIDEDLDKYHNIKNGVYFKKPVHQTIEINHPPVGLVLENRLPLTKGPYDACELKSIDENDINYAITGMSLKSYYPYFEGVLDFDKYFCPDRGDKSQEVFKVSPSFKDDKFYLIEDYVRIKEDTFCKNNKQKQLVKIFKKKIDEGHPILITILSYASFIKYRAGVMEPTFLEKNQNIRNVFYTPVKYGNHKTFIFGYGKDKITGREYWILRNVWGDDWGESGNFRMWIGNNDYEVECNSSAVYLKGELVEKSFNDYYDYEEIYSNVISKSNDYLENIKNMSKKYFGVVMSITGKIVNSTLSEINCTENVPEYIKNGFCVGTSEKKAKTGNNVFYEQEFDKLLLTWLKEDISETTCDFGKYYCDQDQLRISISKKLSLLDKSIKLGDIYFKQFCEEDVCTGVEPVEKINSFFITDIFAEETNLYTSETILDKKRLLKNNINDIPEYLQKYLIVTTTLKKKEQNVFEEILIDNFLDYHKYKINNKTYYQITLNDFLKIIDKLQEHKDGLSIVPVILNDFNIYFGISLNKFVTITKDFGNLKTQENKIFFEKNRFLDDTWSLFFKEDVSEKFINFGIYEYEILDVDKDNKKATIDVLEIKNLFTNNFVKQPINSLSNQYLDIDLFSTSFSDYQIPTTKIDSYLNINEILNNELLSFNTKNTNHLENVVFKDTVQSQIYFGDGLSAHEILDKKTDNNYSVSVLDSYGNSSKLFSSNKSYNQLYLLNDNETSQIEIVKECGDVCEPLITTNAKVDYQETENDQKTLIAKIKSNQQNQTKFVDIINGVKEGKICYLEENNKITFWHNPEYQKYSQYYATTNFDFKNYYTMYFDTGILFKDNINNKEEFFSYHLFVDSQQLKKQANNTYFTQSKEIMLDMNNTTDFYMFWGTDTNILEVFNVLNKIYSLKETTNLPNTEKIEILFENNINNTYKISSKTKEINIQTTEEKQHLIFVKIIDDKIVWDYINIVANDIQDVDNYNLCYMYKNIYCRLFNCNINTSCMDILEYDENMYVKQTNNKIKEETKYLLENNVCLK
jgi:hypothetical protein